MIKKITILFSLVFIISCSNNDNTDTFDISGEFTHTISDCDNTNNNNNEINCVEFIELMMKQPLPFSLMVMTLLKL